LISRWAAPMQSRDDVSAHCPFGTQVGHAPGFRASIFGELTAREFGGYLTGSVRPGGSLKRLFDVYPDFWSDMSKVILQ
jgi:hypothetical protein